MRADAFNRGLLLEELDQRREASRLTWRQVAAHVEVSRSTVSRLLAGATPDLRTLARLVSWLEQPADRYLAPSRGHEPPRLQFALADGTTISVRPPAGEAISPSIRQLPDLVAAVYEVLDSWVVANAPEFVQSTAEADEDLAAGRTTPLADLRDDDV